MSSLTPPTITEAEKTTFTMLRRAKGCFLRKCYMAPPLRGYRLMDAKLNPIQYVNENHVTTLIRKKYIALEPVEKGGSSDWWVSILFSPGKYW